MCAKFSQKHPLRDLSPPYSLAITLIGAHKWLQYVLSGTDYSCCWPRYSCYECFPSVEVYFPPSIGQCCRGGPLSQHMIPALLHCSRMALFAVMLAIRFTHCLSLGLHSFTRTRGLHLVCL